MAAKSKPTRPTTSSGAGIAVLAGINGAGKSSIGGAALRENGGEYYNPDEVARAAKTAHPGLSQTEANAFAWNEGRRRLETAMAAGTTFNFETTLGGKTITRLLIEAAQSGASVRIWFVGLDGVEHHLQRVAERVLKGGHHIPEANIRRRWTSSIANLIQLIPHVTDLQVTDNSIENDPAKGNAPEPQRVLTIEKHQLVFPTAKHLIQTPQWAKPIVYAAYQYFGMDVN